MQFLQDYFKNIITFAKKNKEVDNILNQNNFFLIAGPCIVEGEQVVMDIAGHVAEVCAEFDIPYIFKASYRKANRSSAKSFTGIGDETALNIIRKVSQTFNLPTTTDIHGDEEAALAAQYVDVLQIPAFLCRQSSLLEAAAVTGKVVNIKKGQFMSPEAMVHAVNKVREAGNQNVWLTDRGTTFGYQDLVVDYRGLPTMQQFGTPVVMDCTHSLQQPNQAAGVTGGRPDQIPTIAKAAVAVGVDGLFIETHPNPSKAMSDGANMLPLEKLKPLLESLVKIRAAIRS
jgi:2-dehydro-3-deoxyphosphooctonate aldolase (KDO 8-P synthase)